MHLVLLRHFEVDIWVVFKRFVDVYQAWWYFDPSVHAETHAHSLAFFDVRVLTDDHHFDV